MIKVSVCIPTYNYGRFIGEAIESVLAQTEQDFEIIVSDNASDDDTEKIVRSYVDNDCRISYVRNSTNIGMVDNWNSCLSLASGKYIKFLCADDLLERECLECLSQLLDKQDNYVLAACARKIVDEKGVYPPKVVAFAKKDELLDGHAVIRRCVAAGNVIGEPTAVMFRRSAVQKGFDPSYPQLVDIEMWMRTLENGMFAFTPKVLCQFRQHSDQETKKNLLSKKSFAEDMRLYRVYINKPHIKVGIFYKVMGYLLRKWSSCPLNSKRIR